MSSPTLSIPEDEFRSWHQAVHARSDMRGAAAVAKEMESHLSRASGNHVSVARHQLFSWAESLEGIASRDPRRASAGSMLSLPQVVGDIRAILGGGVAPVRPVARPLTPAPPPGPQPQPEPEPAPAAAPQAAPPPVTYVKGGGATGGGPTEFVAPPGIGEAARRLLREAQNEALVISPWTFGLDSLAQELLSLPSNVAVRLVTRRPDRDDPQFHRQLEQLTRRGAEVRYAQALQTRMIVVDGRKVLLGAASVPAPNAPTREAAIWSADAGVARQAREHFARQFEEGLR